MERSKEFVVLVNELDKDTGQCEKIEAHKKGLLHRAFSVFIINSKDEMLLQQRASTKYHSPNLWTNTCCSHPRKGEEIVEAGKRRLMEELGMQCELERMFHFTYKCKLDNGLIEHELDHVLIGRTDEDPVINPNEVQAVKWMSLEAIEKEMEDFPEKFTIWFKIIFQRLKRFIDSSKLSKQTNN